MSFDFSFSHFLIVKIILILLLSLGIVTTSYAATPQFSLNRLAGSSSFQVVVRSSSAPQVSVTKCSVTSIHRQSKGIYAATVVPNISSGEVSINVRVGKSSVTRTALVFPFVSDNWNQPESVPGLVNTLGTEDSLTVSADGKWLIVGTYSPVDLLCCHVSSILNALPSTTKLCPRASGGDSSSANPACNISFGPWKAPYRPNLFGADRILSTRKIHHDVPPLGIDLPVGEDFSIALPPVSAYGFQQQKNGDFGAPFQLGIQMDGYSAAPFKFVFAGAVNRNKTATLVFSAPDPTRLISGTDRNHLYRVQAVLGRNVNLAKFSVSKGVVKLSEKRFSGPVVVGDIDSDQGNSFYRGGRLWFDNEKATEKDIFFADRAGSGFTTSAKAGFSEVNVDERQPFFQSPYLYFYRGATVARVQLIGSNPSDPKSWGQVENQLVPDSLTANPQVGNIVAVGEPNITDKNGYLYFVYFLRTSNGMNGNVGRVSGRK